MTLSELTALETAYQVLQPLDNTARRRALQWLADALSQTQPLVPSVAAPGSAPTVAAAQAPARRRTKSTITSKRVNARKVKTATHNGAKKKASSGSAERAYRRMPEPALVMKAYERIGTITGLAEHFDVPQHTVTHWARRLRTQGYQIGRNG
jgi:hypothetical protein